MIRLTLPEKPSQLALDEAALTAEFKATNKAVWKKRYIIDALIEMSGNKCAYSEQELGSESRYLEVEHFRHKNRYPDDVVKWGNLLPSCKKCNTTKGDWDVEKMPIVNPLTDTPGDHLTVKAFRYYAKTEKGQNTIDATGINDRKQFVEPRSAIAFKTAELLELLLEKFNTSSKGRKNQAAQRIKSLLEECGPKSPYSAVIATYLLYELPTYQHMKSTLQAAGCWDEAFIAIDNQLTEIAMG